jgi:hypothetical protein
MEYGEKLQNLDQAFEEVETGASKVIRLDE